MSWAKLVGNATIYRDISPASFPADFWGQVDIWIPPSTFEACFDGNLFGFSAGLLDFDQDALFASRVLPGPWQWETEYSVVASSGPDPATTYTLKFHYQAGPSISGVDWYVNGVHIANDPSVSRTPSHRLLLNSQPEGCCCEAVYYTNVLVGTSEGAGDIINDDFSSGLAAWILNDMPASQPYAAVVVSAPSSAPCPTVTVNPPRGLPGETIHVTGSGFAPDRPLTLHLDRHEVEISASSDGSGDTSFILTIPHLPTSGTFEGYDVYLADDEGGIACSESFNVGDGLAICGTTPVDGITTAPAPLVATGGLTNSNNEILDYIFHDGAHWVLWQDTSVTTGLSTFPPPANHTMNATRISADGTSVVDYPIDTGYQWHFDSGSVGDPGLFSTRFCTVGNTPAAPVWDSTWFFTSWSKPIIDAHFATDGANLWVGILTRETVRYPWLDNKDAVGLNPGAANQFVSIAALTAGFTTFGTNTGTGYHRYNTQTDGPINQYKDHAFPVTDNGEQDSGHWSPPVVVMFAFTGGGFTRIGEIDAKYCPGTTSGYGYGRAGILSTPAFIQPSPRGSFFSRLSMCASPNDPGVCHVVWSEGGDWGRVGDGDPCGAGRFVWDGGAPFRSYRVNYTRWSPSGKIYDTDLFSSTVDRTSWFFLNDYGNGGGDFTVGYSYPPQEDFAGILAHDLRNDNSEGRVYLFAAIPAIFQNVNIPLSSNDWAFAPSPAYVDPHGHPFLDNNIVFSDTLHVYELTGGSAVLLQSLDLASLAPTEEETEELWTTITFPDERPIAPADCFYGGPSFMSFNPLNVGFAAPGSAAGPDKWFGISLPYDDPELGVPVYLIHIPLTKRWLPQATTPIDTLGGQYATRSFFRIPCDMSSGFDYLDGVRQPGFTIVKVPIGFIYDLSGIDFFSDEKNLWMPPIIPAAGTGKGFGGWPGAWFDRVCLNEWIGFTNTPPETPGVSNYYLGAQCDGFHYDPDADAITVVTAASLSEPGGGPLFAVNTLYLCRGCRNCKCAAGGVHLAHRF